MSDQIRKAIDFAIKEAESLHGNDHFTSYAFRSRMFRLITESQAIVEALGPQAQRWASVFAAPRDKRQHTIFGAGPAPDDDTALRTGLDEMLGTLQGIKAAVEHGLLNRIENIVLAEAEDDLLEQAKELLDKGYFLAAGVLGRAVLESHLRKWCEREQCSPAKPKPTLDDYKSALYTKQTIGKTEMKQIEAMAAVGNDAAHVKPELKQEQVEWLIQIRCQHSSVGVSMKRAKSGRSLVSHE